MQALQAAEEAGLQAAVAKRYPGCAVGFCKQPDNENGTWQAGIVAMDVALYLMEARRQVAKRANNRNPSQLRLVAANLAAYARNHRDEVHFTATGDANPDAAILAFAKIHLKLRRRLVKVRDADVELLFLDAKQQLAFVTDAVVEALWAYIWDNHHARATPGATGN